MVQTSQTKQLMESENELLIQVRPDNTVIGSVGKIAAHRGKGVLHRAFTAFLIDDHGKILITQRSTAKPLWPLFWDGACSSHQWYPDESAVEAAQRRIPFELGITLSNDTNLEELFTYEYHAVYSPEWAENEINSIVVGTYSGECRLNDKEVAAYEWVTATEITSRLQADPPLLAPWFQYAWDGLLERNWVTVPRA